jgi:predicted ATPase
VKTPRSTTGHKVRTNILNIDPELAPYVPYYLHLLSIHTDPMITHMQGEELRHAMVDALAKVFTRLAARGPTLLILEDWHWRDQPSEQALRHLAGILPDHALLIVMTSRPDHTVSWATFNHHVPMVLSPLDVQDSEWIMQSVFKTEMLPAGLRDLIFERTVGEPLFIEESCHGLIEDGVVVVQERVASPDSTCSTILCCLRRSNRSSAPS